MMDNVDADNNGTMDFPEFFSMLTSRKTSKNLSMTHGKSQSSIISPRDNSERELRDKLQENLTADVINI